MGRFDSVIDELRSQRDKIDAAIEALVELEGGVRTPEPGTVTALAVEPIRRGEAVAVVDARESAAAVVRESSARVVRKTASADSSGRSVRTGRPASTTHHAILDALRTGPKTTAALIRELSPDIQATKIHGMLNYLSQKTHTIRKNERGEWEVIR